MWNVLKVLQKLYRNTVDCREKMQIVQKLQIIKKEDVDCIETTGYGEKMWILQKHCILQIKNIDKKIVNYIETVDFIERECRLYKNTAD